MKNSNFMDLFGLGIVLTTLVIFCSSCKKNDIITPIYIGKWEVTYPFPNGDWSGFTQIKNSLTFDNKTYKSEKFEYLDRNSWVKATAIGTFEVKNDSMKITLNEISISPTNAPTNAPLAQSAIAYKEGDFQFDYWVTKSNQNKIFTSIFSVSNNKLLLKSDFNLDGDYQDTCETIIYSRIR